MWYTEPYFAKKGGLNMNNGKKDAVRVSEVLGCSLLISMLLLLVSTLALQAQSEIFDRHGFFLKALSFAALVLPAIWGTWRFRRLSIDFPTLSAKAALNKKLIVMLSTFGVILISQIFYEAIFPTSIPKPDLYGIVTPILIFPMFFFRTLVPAVAEEIFFRGFFMRCMRVFRASLAVLMSALVYALMHFSVEGFPLFFVMGLLIGMAYLATNSLSTVIAISFLCKAFWFLEETVSVYLPEGRLSLMQGSLAVCVMLSAMGLPYLKENMRAFFENDDDNAVPSAYFWTVPMILFVGLAAGIQLLVQRG
jgi:membrane protease YdiL (CAAX protease family)